MTNPEFHTDTFKAPKHQEAALRSATLSMSRVRVAPKPNASKIFEELIKELISQNLIEVSPDNIASLIPPPPPPIPQLPEFTLDQFIEDKLLSIVSLSPTALDKLIKDLESLTESDFNEWVEEQIELMKTDES